MGWTYVAHPRCFKPFFGLMNPLGSTWRCDVCGKDWLVWRDRNGTKQWSTGYTVTELLAAEYMANLSMEPADVAARELAIARRWLTNKMDGMYAELGLTR